MSVFTPVSQAQLETLLTEYSIGQLTQFEGIDGGTDNSNYFVDTTEGRFVLTIFERLAAEELPFFLSLGDQLSNYHCRVAHPIHDKTGVALKQLVGKPAVIFQRLSGGHLNKPKGKHCQQMGKALAEVHSAKLEFKAIPDNEFGLSWLMKNCDFDDWQESDDKALFDLLLSQFEALTRADIPKGVIHADLFHDNALFEADQLSGIIDWYFACFDWQLLDLAIMINDWCFDGSELNNSNKQVLIEAYSKIRPLTDSEILLLPQMQLLAACRFWLSRTLSWAELKDSNQAGITVKPPGEMKRLIQQLMN